MMHKGGWNLDPLRPAYKSDSAGLFALEYIIIEYIQISKKGTQYMEITLSLHWATNHSESPALLFMPHSKWSSLTMRISHTCLAWAINTMCTV